MGYLFRKLFQKFTPNHWEYYNYNAMPREWDYGTEYYEYRICRNTGRFQEFRRHCLGLNPPQYVGKWHDLNRKPRMLVIDGKTIVK